VVREVRLDNGFRIDIVVNALVLIEVKTVERLLPIHEAQLLTYLKLSDKRLGLLVNFNVPLIKDGIRRLAL
jgi:GxxExxY protein